MVRAKKSELNNEELEEMKNTAEETEMEPKSELIEEEDREKEEDIEEVTIDPEKEIGKIFLEQLEHKDFYNDFMSFNYQIIKMAILTENKEVKDFIHDSKVLGDERFVLLARFGNDEDRAKLIDFKNCTVRQAVAENANYEHCKILLNDDDEEVRSEARRRLNDLNPEEYNELMKAQEE